MFFEKNKNLLIATGAVALLWIILYYVMISPNWDEAGKSVTAAAEKRLAWETATHADRERKDAKDEKRTNDFKPRADAEKELNRSSEQTEIKFKELRRIEFGTRDTLKPYSIAAVGKSGDTKNLLNEKLKQTKDRANSILKVKIEAEKLAARFGDESASDALNLLRLALMDRFLSACKEVKDVNTKESRIEEIVAVDYQEPKPIPVPEDEKAKEKEKDGDDESTENKKPKGKGKDKDKNADKPEGIDRLVQIPMKVLVRAPERYVNQLLYELGLPTPSEQVGEDRRGYFCVRGFHISVSNNTGSTGEKLVEMSVGVSALLRESEVKALGIGMKGERGKRSTDADAY